MATFEPPVCAEKITKSGFMLIEVLMALFILALLMTALIKSVTDNARYTLLLKNKTIGMWVAHNILADIQLGNITPPSDSSNTVKGVTTQLKQLWYWLAYFQETPQKTMWRIDIEVKPASFETPAVVHFVSYWKIPSET